MDGPSTQDALLAEAAGKSGLVWLRRNGEQRWWPAWHVWHEGAVVVVSGPGEQELPDLDGGGSDGPRTDGPRTDGGLLLRSVDVELLLRSKDSGARLLTVPARAQRLDPLSPQWQAAAEALAASRLNSAHAPAGLPAHWREVTAVITRVSPAGTALEQPGSYDPASGAAAPAASAATTSGWRPWHARGRQGRAARRRARRDSAGGSAHG